MTQTFKLYALARKRLEELLEKLSGQELFYIGGPEPLPSPLTHEEELALEGALTKSRLSPCIAVRSEGMVTVVTEKEGLSEGESALLLTLCETHCGVAPSGVKVLCAEKSGT